MSSSRRFAQKPSVQTSSMSPGSTRTQAPDHHLRQQRVAAEAALDVIAHRMVLRLVGADQAFLQQQLDVAVIARARQHRAVAQVVDAAVADVRPPGGALLHEAERAGGARPLLERQLCAERDDVRVCAAEAEVQEGERIEQRLRQRARRP